VTISPPLSPRRAASAAARLATAIALALAAGGCGSATHRSQRADARAAGTAASTFAIGLTEDNALLLAPPPQTAAAGGASAPAQSAQAQLSALRPDYVRLLIDWAALQPSAARPADLEAISAGCARSLGPCLPYRGVGAQLRAIASQQHARGGFTVVIVILDAPSWAARARSGCERANAGADARALTPMGLLAYRALIHDLAALGRREGVGLQWWAAWNEPNDPTFLAPQRSRCAAGAPLLSAAAYAQLVRAMAAQLATEGGERRLVIGELNAYQTGDADRATISEFVNALPSDVLCLADVWSVHSYAARAPFTAAPDAVGQLEQALARRGGCARRPPIWVTEAGAGAPHPGAPWTATAGEESASCAALSQQLLKWSTDSRVRAVFQYSFRDDPAFPVGLVDAQLLGVHRVYRLWLAWRRALTGKGPLSPVAGACG
jgi:hypothetical protein